MYTFDRDMDPNDVTREYNLIDVEIGNKKSKTKDRTIRCTPEFLEYINNYKKQHNCKNASGMIRLRVILFPIIINMLIRLLNSQKTDGTFFVPDMLFSNDEWNLLQKIIESI